MKRQNANKYLAVIFIANLTAVMVHGDHNKVKLALSKAKEIGIMIEDNIKNEPDEETQKPI